MDLTPYFCLSSFERGEDMILLRMWEGALKWFLRDTLLEEDTSLFIFAIFNCLGWWGLTKNVINLNKHSQTKKISINTRNREEKEEEVWSQGDVSSASSVGAKASYDWCGGLVSFSGSHRHHLLFSWQLFCNYCRFLSSISIALFLVLEANILGFCSDPKSQESVWGKTWKDQRNRNIRLRVQTNQVSRGIPLYFGEDGQIVLHRSLKSKDEQPNHLSEGCCWFVFLWILPKK